jgi:hypothetical protein
MSSLRWLAVSCSVLLPVLSIAACNSIAGLDSFDKVPNYLPADAQSEPDAIEAATDSATEDRESEPPDAAAEPDVILIDAPPLDGGVITRKWALWHIPDFVTAVVPGDGGAVPFPAAYVELDAGSDADAAPDADAAAGGKIVLDNVTGMVWEQTISPNAGGLDEAEKHCESLEPAGKWSLPTRIELVSLLNLGLSPAIDPTYFPDTKSYPFWTASKVAGADDSQWGVEFVNGEVVPIKIASSPALVRCVQPAGNPLVHYQPFGPTDHTIVEKPTNLRWQRYVTAAAMTRVLALDYCSQNPPDSVKEWRLPTMKELQSLVDDQPHEEYEGGKLVMKAIDREAFPGTPAGTYWSLSEVPASDGGMMGYVVDFGSGVAKQVPVDGTFARVRCVRYQKL